MKLESFDPDVYQAINEEKKRQNTTLELIASENFTSTAVMQAMGQVMTNKYAEGYPGKRYYGGCENVDVVEELARNRAKKLFKAEHANVQPHSGAQANMAAFFSLVEPGAKVMGMDLAHGGHLTHGSPVNFSGRFFEMVHYGVTENGMIDMDQVRDIALKEKPELIITGASAYAREIDYKAFREIADDIDAKVVADIAHPAGLIAAGLLQSPIPFCHLVTTTTHKTLRGPRGGMILIGKDAENDMGIKTPKGRVKKYSELVDFNVFPGFQGGPLMHVIAAKAVAFREALKPEFKEYQKQVIRNAQVLARELMDRGFHVVSGGTDTHIVLLDVRSHKITGKDSEIALEAAGITANKNMVPFDDQSPFVTSGIRLGTPALTTRGMEEEEMRKVAEMIDTVLSNISSSNVQQRIRKQVNELCEQFPLYD
ncbi:MAG: serine hydroxymethyltransferase [candidate division KSB1 bacterium]|nr:serine hydroxymethyltransferase [candidate division KSB1 bacterium]